jgi:hypothetical protein
MKRLLGPEMHRFEGAMLQCLRHMVNSRFYQPTTTTADLSIEPLVDEFDDGDLSSDGSEEDDEEDYGDFSPISNR